mgnify:CR=1 FL=1
MATYLLFGKYSPEALAAVSAKRTQAAPAVSVEEFDKLMA